MLDRENGFVSTMVVDHEKVRIPAWIVDHSSFRRWTYSDAFPETGRVCYFHGEVWVDMSKEQVFSHNQVKGEYGRTLSNLTRSARSGRYFFDGILYSNVEAGLTTQPDGLFASLASLKSGRIRLIEGVKEGYVELAGTADMVLEVLSASSEEKDLVLLRDLYWQAGIREYWLVDARAEALVFDILRHTSKGYVAARKQAGWAKSTVFGKSFKLRRHKDELENPEYTLAVR
jgi:Uma2 family endonuclease